MGIHLWTNSEPGSFRKQIFLNVIGPISRHPFSFLLSPFSMVSWDFICRRAKSQALAARSQRAASSCDAHPNRLPSPGQEAAGSVGCTSFRASSASGREEAPGARQEGEDIGYTCGDDRNAGWVWISKIKYLRLWRNSGGS